MIYGYLILSLTPVLPIENIPGMFPIIRIKQVNKI